MPGSCILLERKIHKYAMSVKNVFLMHATVPGQTTIIANLHLCSYFFNSVECWMIKSPFTACNLFFVVKVDLQRENIDTDIGISFDPNPNIHSCFLFNITYFKCYLSLTPHVCVYVCIRKRKSCGLYSEYMYILGGKVQSENFY